MISSRSVILAACLIGCTEARQPQPDDPDEVDADMQADAMMMDGSAPDRSVADAAPVDGGADAAVGNQCEAFEFRGQVYDCTVDLCSHWNFRDHDLRYACCQCGDPEENCPPCDNIAG